MAGISWAKYLSFCTLSLLSMLAGSQVVHTIYRPLADLPEYVEKEKARLRALQAEHLDKSNDR